MQKSMKKKTTRKAKVKPIGQRKESKEQVIDVPPFHESFPFTLHHKLDKEKKVCYFVCKEHMDSYIKRYKLKKTEIKIEPTKPRKTEDNAEETE